MTTAALMAILSWGAGAARSATDSGTPAIEFFGRFDFSQPAGPRFDWPGSAIKARFQGTSVAAKLRNGGGDINFSVVIDGGSPRIIKSTSGSTTSFELASGLHSGEHTVLLMRNNEAWNGPTQFLGFDFGGGSLLAPVAFANPHRIEVYGDSISAAFGNMRTDGCTDYAVDDQDVYLGYAATAARLLGAPPPTLIAWSGKGVYHNGAGAPANVDTIPLTFDRTLGNEKSVWGFPADKTPDIVVIALGTNDFNPLPSGQMPSMSALADAYVAFGRTLRSRYPKASLIFGVGPMGYSYRPAVLGAISTLNGAGAEYAHALTFSPMKPPMGCNGHPSAATDAVMASELVAELKKLGF